MSNYIIIIRCNCINTSNLIKNMRIKIVFQSGGTAANMYLMPGAGWAGCGLVGICLSISVGSAQTSHNTDITSLFLFKLCFSFLISLQFIMRNSSRELLQVLTPLFQNNLSFRQVMAAASSLVCGYTEGAFSRVTSFNWYEDNNYKAFLGISSGRAQDRYTYDNSTSE